MNIRCLIVDDEPPAVRLISSYIQQIPGIETVAVCNNAIDAFRILGAQKIDLLFLDIKMPNILGTEFLRTISNPPKVIFITAYREYAMDGYDLDIVDYLLKPVSFTRFMKAISKATRQISMDNNYSSVNNETDKNKDPFLYLKIDKEMKKVLLHDILFIESSKDYTKLHLENQKYLLVKQSLSSLERLLSPHIFLRVHRSYIVPIDRISSFKSNYITIINNKIPIGRLYKNEVEKALKS